MKQKQASGRHCFVCGVENAFGLGLKFYELSPGEVTAETTIAEHFQGYPGVVHGGIVAAMLDEVSARSFSGDDPPRFMVTVQLSVRYRRPVPVGQRLVLKGHAIQDKGRSAIAKGEIYDEQGVLLAEADAVLANIPTEQSQGWQSGTDDWKVYPD